MTSKKKSTARSSVPSETELKEQGAATDDRVTPIELKQETLAKEEPPKGDASVEKNLQCPFEATIAVSLAVLRKSIEPATADMLRPVATLKQGTKITITDIHGGNARLANGLWIALEYITR